MSRRSKGGGGNYEVGYGRPPEQHRFVKGQSGNPSGRPKGKKPPAKQHKLMQLLNKVSQREITITVNEQRVTMTMMEAILTKTAHQALGGKQDAVRTLLNYQTDADECVDRHPVLPTPDEIRKMDPHAAARAYQMIVRGPGSRKK